jgi:outer membrane protein
MPCGVARADDLATLYREALTNNTQYRSAEAQYAATREKVPESVASFLPAISLAANSLWNNNDSNTLGRQQYNSNYYTVQLTQPLWRPGNLLTLDQARLLVVEAKAQLDRAQQDLLVHTAQAYFDVLFAQDALNTFRDQAAADLQQLQQATRSFEVGAAPITDKSDAEARYALVTAQEIAANNEIESKRQVLRQIIGKEPGPLAQWHPGAALASPVPDKLTPWEEAAQTDNPAVVGAQAALEVARLEAKRSRASYLPSIDLIATHGMSNSQTDIVVGQRLHEDTVGVQLSLPLYAGGGPSAKTRENLALVEKAHVDVDDAQRSNVLAADQAFLGVTSGLALVRALEHALTAAQTAVESNRRGLDVGARLVVDVMNAEQQVAATKRDLAKARYDTVMSLLRLKAAAGSLNPADVDDVNALLTK